MQGFAFVQVERLAVGWCADDNTNGVLASCKLLRNSTWGHGSDGAAVARLTYAGWLPCILMGSRQNAKVEVLMHFSCFHRYRRVLKEPRFATRFVHPVSRCST
jgi:hypothetical protein